jgi:hypothetical protein
MRQSTKGTDHTLLFFHGMNSDFYKKLFKFFNFFFQAKYLHLFFDKPTRIGQFNLLQDFVAEGMCPREKLILVVISVGW